jgi:Ca-activated chloride channel family protein
MRLPTLLLLTIPACLAQNDLSIKVAVRLVNVTFTARDANGKLITDLTKDDFEVIDDGAPQTISFFSRSVDLPLALGIIADMSGSQERFVRQHEHDIDNFLKKNLTKRDQAFVLCFDNKLRLMSDLSADRKALMEGLKRWDRKTGGHDMPEIGPLGERRILGTAFYDALYYATTERLAKVDTGRKALLVFSDGEDNSSARHMLDAIESAQGEGVIVYGLRYTEIDSRRGPNARNKYGTSVMRRIAHDTGGRDFDAEEDDLRTAFAEIGEELRSSYDLAYHSPSADGTFHKIVVRCKQPGVTIRAKTGYFSSGAGF